MWSFTVLHLHDGVVVAQVYNFLFLNLGVLNVVDKSPADAAAGACVNESVLWTCVESVLPVNEFRVQDDVALLAL